MSLSFRSLCLTVSVMTSSVSALGSSASMEPFVSSSSTPCATKDISDEKARFVTQQAHEIVTKLEMSGHSVSQNGGVINVYWHSIQSSTGQGYLSSTTINKQISDLNKACSVTGWSFSLKNIDRYTYDPLFNMAPGGGEDMKNYLHIGGARDLNIYSTQITDNVLGWATFPWDYEDSPSQDGVVLDWRTLAGAGFAGDTGVHEVGHWMGLLHTFQGGCSGGDYVSDTPPVAAPNYRCNVGVDSCPGGGVDLVKNFMDYTEDSCMDSFTAGQFTRAQTMWNAYRRYSTLETDASSNQESSSAGAMHTALYAVAGVVGVAAVAAAVLYKKKRDQAALDEEFVSVVAAAGSENPLQQQHEEAAGVELSSAQGSVGDALL